MALTFTCDYCKVEYEIKKVTSGFVRYGYRYKYGIGEALFLDLFQMSMPCMACNDEAEKAQEARLEEIKNANK